MERELDTEINPAFLKIFCERAGASGQMRFDEFMTLALYDPVVGYYRAERARVGRAPGTDFFTSSTSGPVFGELVSSAAASLLEARGQAARDYVFVEIGAETETGVLAGVAHPFGGVRTIRVGEQIAGHPALAGKCVVFSNELFDAQPFRRFVFRGNVWHELAVALTDDGKFCEVELACVEGFSVLPESAPEGWHLDLPFASVTLAREIVAQPWSGLFIGCDYGKSWRELVEEAFAGTGRAYFRHTQSNDLLAHPGRQDLTCHVCWDWLVEALRGANFSRTEVESQEAFFMHHAGRYLEAAFAAAASAKSAAGSRKHALMQLLHPANMGQKFQVLHGWRG